MVFDVISVFLFANFLYTMVLPNRYKKAYVKSHIYNKNIYKVKKEQEQTNKVLDWSKKHTG